MIRRPPVSAAVAVLALAVMAGAASARPAPEKAGSTPMHAKGPFDVKLVPQADAGDGVARMSLEKQFHGDLDASSQGQMLAVGDARGSGGYVAIERVNGVLGGRKGAFVLQHTGTMNHGVPSLTITVVPDSGTEELAGLAGKMDIRIEPGGKHYYDFEYTVGGTR